MEYLTLLASVVLRINLLVSSRFGEGLRIVQDHLDSRNFYAFNPAFDKGVNANSNGCCRNGRCRR